MTREEREARIKEIERKQFMLAMKDWWTDDDFKRDRKMTLELIELKKGLE